MSHTRRSRPAGFPVAFWVQEQAPVSQDLARSRVSLRRRIRVLFAEKGHPMPNINGWTLDELDSFLTMVTEG